MRIRFLTAAVATSTLTLAACQDTSGPPTGGALPRTAGAVVAGRGAAEVIPGQYIVVLRVDAADVPDVARRLAAASGGSLKHVYGAALKGFALRVPSEEAIEAIRGDAAIAYIEQDQVVHLDATQSGATWGLDRIDQRDLPLSTTYTYAATGDGVRAYIIDTGINFDHSEFAGGRATSGYDAVDGGAADDCNGHGTHVAGTVGGSVYGVAKSVALIGVRVLDCGGSGSTSGVIAGVDWVTSNAVKPAVANMSLGGSASTSLDNAVTNSINSGVTYAIAAGNGNIFGIAQNACNSSPAAVPAAITVSATSATDTRASWANYGTCVDIFAPGVSITSAWIGGASALNTINGTSMAAPHVAGAAAVYLETHPTETPAQVASALVSSATLNKVVSPGSGSPNRLLFVDGSGGGGGGTDARPVASFIYTCNGFTCDFDGRGSSDDGAITAYDWTFSTGGTAVGAQVSKTFSRRTSPVVTLTVTDDAGQTNSTSKTLSCNQKRCQ